jgi:peptidoglycan/LPS O-acetylase OafA/YrhL
VKERGESWRLGYRPGLDGLRGIAVALVLVNHTGLDYTGTAGTIGVNVFFVLSGFLITRLLIEERDEFGSVSLHYFYVRRSLRIFPAMYAFLAATAVVAIIYAQPLKQLA